MRCFSSLHIISQETLINIWIFIMKDQMSNFMFNNRIVISNDGKIINREKLHVKGTLYFLTPNIFL